MICNIDISTTQYTINLHYLRYVPLILYIIAYMYN